MRAAILLAAGSSRRFAGGNKLLARIGARPLLAHALTSALAAPAGRIIVVVGADHLRTAALARAVGGGRVVIVRARDHETGMAASLRAGLAALRPIERELFVFLGDMPFVPPALARRLVRLLKPGVGAARPWADAVPGHPVLLRRPGPALVARLARDRGLGALLQGEIRWLPSHSRLLADVDSRRDLARLGR